MPGIVSYRRPAFPTTTFRDASGALIEYGRRWRERPGGMPPNDSYEVVSHPERFAPLHAIADALVEYLTTRYEAVSSEDLAFVSDLTFEHSDVLRAVRVTPARRDAASLTFVYTNRPAVLLHAGMLHDFPFPGCGCDACDETAESAAGEIEEIVMAVAEGRYREWLDAGDESLRPPGQWANSPPAAARGADVAPPQRLPDPWAGYEIAAPDGSFRRRGEAALSGLPEERLAPARVVFGRMDEGWQPWPLREG